MDCSGFTGSGQRMARPSHLGNSALAAREWFVTLWQCVRPTIIGREAAVPRIWNTWGKAMELTPREKDKLPIFPGGTKLITVHKLIV